MNSFQEQFTEQRRIAEEFCFLNRTKSTGLEEFLSQSEQRQILIKDWNLDIVSQVLNYRRSSYSFSNAKSALLAFCKYAGYKDMSDVIPQAKYTNVVSYYPSFLVMRMEIRRNIKELNLFDERCYDNLVITAYLLAMGLTIKEISEAKKADYCEGTLRVGNKTLVFPEDFVHLMKLYYATENYNVCNNKKVILQNYHESECFIKNTTKPVTTLRTIQEYSKRLPIICDGKGSYEIKTSRIMWELFQKSGYDLENPNVLCDTDWESVKQKKKVPCPKNITRVERDEFFNTLIQYRNSI